MNRRNWFKKVFGAAVATIAAPLVPNVQAVAPAVITSEEVIQASLAAKHIGVIRFTCVEKIGVCIANPKGVMKCTFDKAPCKPTTSSADRPATNTPFVATGDPSLWKEPRDYETRLRAFIAESSRS